MTPGKKTFIGLLSLVALLLQDCIREDFQWGHKVGEITYSRDAVFLGSEEMALLKVSRGDTITFDGLTEELKSITENNILVCGVSDSTPVGFLRKVASVTLADSSLVLTTKDAILTDAILEGTISFHERLLEKDFMLKSKTDGVLVDGPSKSFDGLAITLDNFEVFNNGNVTAKLNGSVGISPEIDMTVVIESGQIKEMDLTTTLNIIEELTVSSDGAISGSTGTTAAEFLHSPVVIDNLVFVPEIRIRCGFDGMVAGKVSSGVRQERVITSRLRFQDGNWSEDPLIHSESYDFTIPMVADSSNLKIFSGVDISMKLFNTPVQEITSAGYYLLESVKAASPSWKLFSGNEGTNVVDPYILGLAKGFSSGLVIEKSEIAGKGDN